MGIAAEVIEDLLRTPNRRLGVDHPLGRPHRLQIRGKLLEIRKLGERRGEVELVSIEGALQGFSEEPTKEP